MPQEFLKKIEGLKNNDDDKKNARTRDESAIKYK